MIKIKMTRDDRVRIKVTKCKTQAQLMGEIGVVIKAIVRFAMLRAKMKENIVEELATATTLGVIFDDSMDIVEDMVKAGIDLNDELETKDLDVTIDLANLDEIVKQMKEMQDGEEE